MGGRMKDDYLKEVADRLRVFLDMKIIPGMQNPHGGILMDPAFVEEVIEELLERRVVLGLVDGVEPKPQDQG